MTKRKIVPVDEQLLQDMIAGENVNIVANNRSSGNEVKEDDKREENENVKMSKDYIRSGKRKQPGYEELYLVFNPVSKYDRQQVYIDGGLYEKFSRFLKIVSGQKVSMSSFINNILSQHWENNKEIINELYDKNLHKPL